MAETQSGLPGKGRPLRADIRLISGGLAAESRAVAIPATVVIESAVEMAAEQHGAAVEVVKRSDADDTDEVPVSGDPVAVGVVAGHPDLSGARAWRSVGNRPANADSILRGLG